MQEVINLFEEIKNTSSSNEKIGLIARNSENELFVECLKFLLDKNIVTGLSKKKIEKDVNETDYMPETFMDVITYLKSNNTGTDYDISFVRNFINDQPEENKDWYKEIVTKRYKLGVTVKSLNKAIPNAIVVHEIQQAYPINDKNKPKEGEWFALSQKINGTNCSLVNGKMISRQGKEFSYMDHIVDELNRIGLGGKFVNGELVRRNSEGLTDNENFQKSVSVINSDSSDKSEIVFIIYEALDMEEYYEGQSKETFKQRFLYMNELKNIIEKSNLNYIQVVPYFYCGSDQSMIKYWLDYADSNNMEGIMLNKDTKWQNKRNNGILKIKSFKSCDILCTGVEEGDGKYKGTLGKIICDYKGYDLSVGSGFTDEDRKLFWEHPDLIVGRVVEVKYKAETKNKDGGLSVQFGTFQCIREVGKEISYN